MNTIHLDILSKARQQLLPLLQSVKQQFYLAGGTGLALQIGHRDSIDFDFFTHDPFDTANLDTSLQEVFQQHSYQKIQEEKDTLTVIIDNDIKISFFGYPYELIAPLVDISYLALASIIDIGCMKLSAITGRSTLKDYVDLYYILHMQTLSDLLEANKQKHPTLDTNLLLKSLVYFDDIEMTPLHFMPGKEVSMNEVKEFLREQIKAYASGFIH